MAGSVQFGSRPACQHRTRSVSILSAVLDDSPASLKVPFTHNRYEGICSNIVYANIAIVIQRACAGVCLHFPSSTGSCSIKAAC